MNKKFYVSYYIGPKRALTLEEQLDFLHKHGSSERAIEAFDSAEKAIKRKKELEKEDYVLSVSTNAE